MPFSSIILLFSLPLIQSALTGSVVDSSPQILSGKRSDVGKKFLRKRMSPTMQIQMDHHKEKIDKLLCMQLKDDLKFPSYDELREEVKAIQDLDPLFKVKNVYDHGNITINPKSNEREGFEPKSKEVEKDLFHDVWELSKKTSESNRGWGLAVDNMEEFTEIKRAVESRSIPEDRELVLQATDTDLAIDLYEKSKVGGFVEHFIEKIARTLDAQYIFHMPQDEKVKHWKNKINGQDYKTTGPKFAVTIHKPRPDGEKDTYHVHTDLDKRDFEVTRYDNEPDYLLTPRERMQRKQTQVQNNCKLQNDSIERSKPLLDSLRKQEEVSARTIADMETERKIMKIDLEQKRETETKILTHQGTTRRIAVKTIQDAKSPDGKRPLSKSKSKERKMMQTYATDNFIDVTCVVYLSKEPMVLSDTKMTCYNGAGPEDYPVADMRAAWVIKFKVTGQNLAKLTNQEQKLTWLKFQESAQRVLASQDNINFVPSKKNDNPQELFDLQLMNEFRFSSYQELHDANIAEFAEIDRLLNATNSDKLEEAKNVFKKRNSWGSLGLREEYERELMNAKDLGSVTGIFAQAMKDLPLKLFLKSNINPFVNEFIEGVVQDLNAQYMMHMPQDTYLYRKYKFRDRIDYDDEMTTGISFIVPIYGSSMNPLEEFFVSARYYDDEEYTNTLSILQIQDYKLGILKKKHETLQEQLARETRDLARRREKKANCEAEIQDLQQELETYKDDETTDNSRRFSTKLDENGNTMRNVDSFRTKNTVPITCVAYVLPEDYNADAKNEDTTLFVHTTDYKKNQMSDADIARESVDVSRCIIPKHQRSIIDGRPTTTVTCFNGLETHMVGYPVGIRAAWAIKFRLTRPASSEKMLTWSEFRKVAKEVALTNPNIEYDIPLHRGKKSSKSKKKRKKKRKQSKKHNDRQSSANTGSQQQHPSAPTSSFSFSFSRDRTARTRFIAIIHSLRKFIDENTINKSKSEVSSKKIDLLEVCRTIHTSLSFPTSSVSSNDVGDLITLLLRSLDLKLQQLNMNNNTTSTNSGGKKIDLHSENEALDKISTPGTTSIADGTFDIQQSAASTTSSIEESTDKDHNNNKEAEQTDSTILIFHTVTQLIDWILSQTVPYFTPDSLGSITNILLKHTKQQLLKSKKRRTLLPYAYSSLLTLFQRDRKRLSQFYNPWVDLLLSGLFHIEQIDEDVLNPEDNGMGQQNETTSRNCIVIDGNISDNHLRNKHHGKCGNDIAILKISILSSLDLALSIVSQEKLKDIFATKGRLPSLLLRYAAQKDSLKIHDTLSTLSSSEYMQPVKMAAMGLLLLLTRRLFCAKSNGMIASSTNTSSSTNMSSSTSYNQRSRPDDVWTWFRLLIGNDDMTHGRKGFNNNLMLHNNNNNFESRKKSLNVVKSSKGSLKSLKGSHHRNKLTLPILLLSTINDRTINNGNKNHHNVNDDIVKKNEIDREKCGNDDVRSEPGGEIQPLSQCSLFPIRILQCVTSLLQAVNVLEPLEQKSSVTQKKNKKPLSGKRMMYAKTSSSVTSEMNLQAIRVCHQVLIYVMKVTLIRQHSTLIGPEKVHDIESEKVSKKISAQNGVSNLQSSVKSSMVMPMLFYPSLLESLAEYFQTVLHHNVDIVFHDGQEEVWSSLQSFIEIGRESQFKINAPIGASSGSIKNESSTIWHQSCRALSGLFRLLGSKRKKTSRLFSGLRRREEEKYNMTINLKHFVTILVNELSQKLKNGGAVANSPALQALCDACAHFPNEILLQWSTQRDDNNNNDDEKPRRKMRETAVSSLAQQIETLTLKEDEQGEIGKEESKGTPSLASLSFPPSRESIHDVQNSIPPSSLYSFVSALLQSNRTSEEKQSGLKIIVCLLKNISKTTPLVKKSTTNNSMMGVHTNNSMGVHTNALENMNTVEKNRKLRVDQNQLTLSNTVFVPKTFIQILRTRVIALLRNDPSPDVRSLSAIVCTNISPSLLQNEFDSSDRLELFYAALGILRQQEDEPITKGQKKQNQQQQPLSLVGGSQTSSAVETQKHNKVIDNLKLWSARVLGKLASAYPIPLVNMVATKGGGGTSGILFLSHNVEEEWRSVLTQGAQALLDLAFVNDDANIKNKKVNKEGLGKTDFVRTGRSTDGTITQASISASWALASLFSRLSPDFYMDENNVGDVGAIEDHDNSAAAALTVTLPFSVDRLWSLAVHLGQNISRCIAMNANNYCAPLWKLVGNSIRALAYVSSAGFLEEIRLINTIESVRAPGLDYPNDKELTL
eukprot:g2129.t1